MTKLFPLIALLAQGCLVSEATRSIYVDKAFSPAEAADIQSAADAWSGATGGAAQIRLVFEWDTADCTGCRTIRRVESRDHPFAGYTQPYEFMGVETSEEITLWIYPTMPPLRDTVLHEFGHHLGLGHLTDPASAMFFKVDPAARHCLTASDVSAYCDTHGCVERRPCM